jgi:hypothetical protein
VRKPTEANIKPLAVSIATACRITSLGRSKVNDLLGDGRLESVDVDGRRLVIYESLEQLTTPKPRGGPPTSI